MIGLSQGLLLSGPAVTTGGQAFHVDNRLFGGRYFGNQLFAGAFAHYSATPSFERNENYYALGVLGRHYFLNRRISPFVELNASYQHHYQVIFNPLSSFVVNPNGGYMGGKIGITYRFELVGIEVNYGQKRAFSIRNQEIRGLSSSIEAAINFYIS